MSDLDLAARWRGKATFVVLDTGFDSVGTFLATWAAWQDDPARCGVLHYIAIAPGLPGRAGVPADARDPPRRALRNELATAWPPSTRNLHRLVFEGGSVHLLLAFGKAAAWLPQIDAAVDAFLLDGGTVPDARLFKTIARLAAPAAVVRAAAASPGLSSSLRSAGFVVDGDGEASRAAFAPRFVPRTPARRRAVARSSDEPVVIVGAGLAGCATACALAELGRSSVVVERCGQLAAEGSGNAVGLFHGVVHRGDGRHARFHRAAALAAHPAVADAIGRGEAGSVGGLLRVEPGGATLDDLQRTIDGLVLPPDYVRAVDAAEASWLAGTAIGTPAWFFAHGGWVDPRGLCRAYLARGGGRVELRMNCPVASLRRDGNRWRLQDAEGNEIANAAVVVLANAGAALDLAGRPAWPIRRSRGQVSSLPEADWSPGSLPRIPVTGAGYVAPAASGRVWFGATSQPGDEDSSVRVGDHLHNLSRLGKLLRMAPQSSTTLCGRVGFRWSADDRLPVIGAVPELAVSGGPAPLRLDQPRFVPRAPGLYVFTALGSRGIATSAIGGAVIAAAITGAPSPLELDLLDAIDPGRFVSRAVRRGVQPPVGVIAEGSAGA